MFAIFKKVVSKFTFPTNQTVYSYNGDYFVQSSLPEILMLEKIRDPSAQTYLHTYTKIVQTKTGRWKRDSLFLSTDQKLFKVVNLETNFSL